jgi:hypothetical protein
MKRLHIWLVLILAATLACQSLAPIQIASAASLNISGTWNEIYHCASGWCAGSDFPDTLALSQAAGSSAVTGTDSVGSTIRGSLTGHSLTLHVVLGSYTADFKLTVAANGRSWTGSATDSNHTSGTSTATRKLKLLMLSGTLWISDCTDQSCSRVGAEGDALGVSGKDSDGNAVSKSATSGTGGRWSTNVPAGTYTITPAAGFVPDSKTVVAKGNVAGIDFATCGALHSSAIHHIVLTQGSRVRSDAASGETGCPDGIDYKLLDRTAEVPGIATNSGLGMLHQKDIYAPFLVHLYLSVNGSRVTHCAPGSVWKWSVKAKPAGAKILTGPISPGCVSEMIVDKQGTYTVVARRSVKGEVRQTITENVPVRDLLIIAMGDSNGSGEGLPPFWFDECDRGSASYQYQTAGLLEKQSQFHSSVTFVSASCSGARIAHLINTPYTGINDGPPLPAQIEQIDNALQPPAGAPARTVDAALISIGINDLGFGPILLYCIALARNEKKACEDAPTRAVPATGPVDFFYEDSSSKTTLTTLINERVRGLADKYRQLAQELSSSGLVKPHQVYLTQYPSFMYKDNQGHLCPTGGTGSGWTRFRQSTWGWLALEGASLNNAVAAAAAAHGWNVVIVPRQLFYGHGYCSKDPWFVGAIQAKINQNVNGAFHPTERGAKVTAVLTLKDLCPLLGDKRFCKNFPEP